jgi:hypothetical protein
MCGTCCMLHIFVYQMVLRSNVPSSSDCKAFSLSAAKMWTLELPSRYRHDSARSLNDKTLMSSGSWNITWKWSGWNLTWNFAHLQNPSSNDYTQYFSSWYAAQGCGKNHSNFAHIVQIRTTVHSHDGSTHSSSVAFTSALQGGVWDRHLGFKEISTVYGFLVNVQE